MRSNATAVDEMEMGNKISVMPNTLSETAKRKVIVPLLIADMAAVPGSPGSGHGSRAGAGLGESGWPFGTNGHG